MKFESFQSSEKGEVIGALLGDGATIDKMVKFSHEGKPALLAVVRDIERAVDALDNTEKQHVGRWVHRLLGPRGWRPTEQQRLSGSRLFKTASVYRLVDGANGRKVVHALHRQSSDGASRLAKARKKIATLKIKPQSSQQFVAEKRRDAKREH